MVNIVSQLKESKVKNIRFFLNYPKVELKNDDLEVGEFVKIVNKIIENDVNIFEEVVIATFDEESIIGNINAISEFICSFNKNNIISIPIEFSQIVGFTDISHIYSYNYDFNIMERITLEKIFKDDVDFERVIQNYITEEIYGILDKYKSNIGYDIYELMLESIYICDNPVFYFNNRQLVICISSFELTSQICNLIEFPIDFKKLKNILSDYALENIVDN